MWFCVCLWDDKHIWFQLLDQLIGLLIIQRGVDGTVKSLHGQWLEGRQYLQIRKVRLREYDGVVRVIAPHLDKVNSVAETQARMATKDHAGL